jgi:hypothetical protein
LGGEGACGGAAGRFRRGAQQVGRRTEYGRGKGRAESAAGLAADHPVARDRALAGQGMPAAAGRCLPAAGQRHQPIEQTHQEREHQRMRRTQLRRALLERGEVVGEGDGVCLHAAIYN